MEKREIRPNTLSTPYGDPIDLHGYPNECPVCHFLIEPKEIGSIEERIEDKTILQVVFKCANQKCKRLFIATCEKLTGLEFYYYYIVRSIQPKRFKEFEFSVEINTLSPNFVAIYNQAFKAENYALDQLCGTGYRKALEYLLKDFAIKYNPDEKEKISAMFISKVIDKYIDDPRIKDSASRASWLGNDETHYDRKWEDKDVADLKQLVRLTVNWIEIYLLTNKYVEEMPKGGSSQYREPDIF